LKEAYGSQLWRQSVASKPAASQPYWSLETLLALYSRHHPTLLCPAFPATSHCLLKALEKIRHRMKVERISGSLLGEIEELLEVVAARDDYNGAVDATRDKLEKLRQRQEESHRDLFSLEVDQPPENPAGVESLFQTVWESMAAFTLALAESFQIECHIEPPSHEVAFGCENDAKTALPDFLAAVSSLWEALADSIAAGQTSPTAPDMQVLHTRLTNFNADSRAGKSPSYLMESTVTVEQLGRWLRSEDQQEAVMVGLQQLQEMRSTLMACSARLAQEDI